MKINLSQHVHWQQDGISQTRMWYSEAGLPPPESIVLADDNGVANTLFRCAQEGRGILWQGDYPNARNMLSALIRRVDRPTRVGSVKKALGPKEIFEAHRADQKRRATLLAQLLIPVSKNFEIQLRRGQDVQEALSHVLEKTTEDFLISLRGLLAIVSAYEWHKKGVEIPFLQNKITPYFGVFSPARSEYIDLVAQQPLPMNCHVAFDIGVGTGVLSAVLAKRGIEKIIATDIDPRAIECATYNIQQLGYAGQIEIVHQPLFPLGKANLIVCNPPWLPVTPSSPIEKAVFDENSNFLKNFLLEAHHSLVQDGRIWLILSDLAEHLELRTRNELMEWIHAGGLEIAVKKDIRPHHPKTRNNDDPLFFARSREITSLWELKRL